ncbi:MAG TPA: IclR family transcriptional regulator [Solirubrobacteraceae bacterium]|nr:IclR family transcriptional regulator [Solirubrobacteraceae bacterium]
MGDEAEDRDEPRPFPILREARYSRSLERGLAILGCFTPEHPMLGIAELAERLGMSRPTTHRYVSTLVSLGYLEQDASRKYRLALGTIDLGAGLSAMGLCAHARPHLEELSQRSGHTAEIAVLDGLEILLLDRVRGKRTGSNKRRESVGAGSRLPAYCTSMGKVLLAYLPKGLREKLISEMDLTKHGPRTITSKAALSGQLEDVANEGLAINDEELIEGSFAIAAPVREESGDVIAAVGLVAYGGAVDAKELVDRYEGKLVAAAEKVSREIGWRGETG